MDPNYSPSRFSSTPIAKLPVELLSHIFVLTTHTPSEPQDDDPVGGYRPPFNLDSVITPITLSSVSHHWRSIALSTPALWTSLCVSVGDIEPPQEESHESFGELAGVKKTGVLNTTPLTSYLALSRNYPVDIFIDARDEDWDYTEDECVAFLSVRLFNLVLTYGWTPEYHASSMNSTRTRIHSLPVT